MAISEGVFFQCTFSIFHMGEMMISLTEHRFIEVSTIEVSMNIEKCSLGDFIHISRIFLIKNKFDVGLSRMKEKALNRK